MSAIDFREERPLFVLADRYLEILDRLAPGARGGIRPGRRRRLEFQARAIAAELVKQAGTERVLIARRRVLVPFDDGEEKGLVPFDAIDLDDERFRFEMRARLSGIMGPQLAEGTLTGSPPETPGRDARPEFSLINPEEPPGRTD